VDDAPRSRLTVALAILAIVLAVGLLLVGAVLAPRSEPVEGSEASLGSASPPASTPTTAVHVHDTSPPGPGAPATPVDHGAHAGHEIVAIAGPAPAAAHAAHAEHAAEDHAGHAEHVVSAPDAAVPVSGHHHGGTTTTTTSPPPTTTTTTSTVPSDDEQTLLASTFAGLTRFADAASLVADGYAAAGTDGGYQRFVNDAYLADGHERDAMHVEEVVLDATGAIVAGAYVTDGSTQYVWLVPQPCGQLAPIEEVVAGC
jgi:hypothetical protein